MRSFSAAVAALCVVGPLAGCGDADTTAGDAVEHGYDGPLSVARAEAKHPRAGAAGEVVDCRTWGSGGSVGEAVYSGGETVDNPVEALKVAGNEGGFGGVHEGLVVAKEEADRVLFVLEVGGAVKQAVIVRDGPASDGAGWYVESWAHCDYSELPRSFTDSIGLQIWTDAQGRAAPTNVIESSTGPQHCDWQSMTFLRLGRVEYVRDPHEELADYFADPYEKHATLPDDAVDTGFERGGDHLWLSHDKQRAFVGSQDDVEAWPRALQRLGCA